MIEEMLRDLSLEDKAHVLPAELSGGMKRKLCVGIAFMGGSKVVFLGMCRNTRMCAALRGGL